MFWVSLKSKRSRAVLALGAAALAAVLPAGEALAQSMVVRSTGPSAGQYPAGRKLAVNSKITLKANDQVTVLDANGTRVLSGPGTYTLDSAVSRDQAGNTQIASLLATGGPPRRARTGATRGAGVVETVQRSPNLWFVDAGKSGKFCVAEPSRLLI